MQCDDNLINLITSCLNEKNEKNVRFVRNILTFVALKRFAMKRTVTASLGSHFEEFITNIIHSGRYNNASEVIRAALRRLEEDEFRLAALRAALDEGDASPDVEDFNPAAFLQELKTERNNK